MERMNKSGIMFAMWIGLGIAIFGVSIYGAETGADITPLVLAPIVLGLLATLLITLLPDSTTRRTVEDTFAQKGKRESGDGLGALLAYMDEDERADFIAALKDRMLDSAGRLAETDPDVVSLADLMVEDERRTRSAG